MNVRVTWKSNGELEREATGRTNSLRSPVLEGIIKLPADRQYHQIMKKCCVHLVFLFVVVWLTWPAAGDEFTLGLLIPYSLPFAEKITIEYLGEYFAPAIIQAVEDVNNRSDLLPGHHLSFIWNDTHCNETVSLKSMWYQVNERRVSAIIGPACSCRTEARLASALDIPMISYVSCRFSPSVGLVSIKSK